MFNFKMENELGIEYEYYIVAYAIYSGESYVIYTDMVNDGPDRFRLFCGKPNGDQVQKIDRVLERTIINEFR